MGLVTITYDIGSGGYEISKLVAQKLGVVLYDDNRLQEEAMNMEILIPESGGFDERAPGLFDLILARRPDVYKDLMESLVFGVGRKGEGVIIGHGSQMLLHDFECAFHVRVYSPRAHRIKRVKETRRIESRTAERYIDKIDNQKKGFFRFAFHRNLDESSLYDLHLNTAKIGPQAAAELITSAINDPLIVECTLNALDTMGRMSLVRRVEAELLKHQVNLNYITVKAPEVDKIIISGLIPSETAKNDVSRLVKKVVEKTVKIENLLTLLPMGH